MRRKLGKSSRKSGYRRGKIRSGDRNTRIKKGIEDRCKAVVKKSQEREGTTECRQLRLNGEKKAKIDAGKKV